MSYENIPKNATETAVLVEPSPDNPAFNVNLQSPDPVNTYPVAEFRENVALGVVPGHELAVLQGENLDVDTATPENLWAAGGRLIYPTTGEQLEVVSTAASDNIVGTGAQAVIIFYLDVNYEEQSEVVPLTGTTPATTVATDILRVQEFLVAQAGTDNFNNGDLELRVAGGGNPRAYMLATENAALHGFYTVPAGKTGFVVYGNASCKRSDEAKVDIYLTQGESNVFRRFRFADLFAGTTYLQPTYPIGPLQEKSDIQFLAVSENANNEISAFLHILLVDNPE